jgi:hypothetical protein
VPLLSVSRPLAFSVDFSTCITFLSPLMKSGLLECEEYQAAYHDLHYAVDQ